MAQLDPVSSVVRFGPFEVDVQGGELRKNGVRMHLQEKPFQVLAVLLEHPGKVVTRELLRQRLWTDVNVDFEHSLSTAVKKLRDTLGDTAEIPRFVETVRRHGYRFIYPLENHGHDEAAVPLLPRRLRARALAGAGLMALLAGILALNFAGLRERLLGRPAVGEIRSIAVLPFENLMHDAEQDYFVEGMHSSLISELSKISALKVISRTSAMQFKDTKLPLPEVARRLGVEGLIEGSVLREGDRVRVTVNLVHGPSDSHLWAETFDRELRGVLELYGEVARAIAREVQAQLTPQEQTHFVGAVRQIHPEAHDAYLKGRFFYYKQTKQDLPTAIRYAQQVIQVDPGYAPAHALLAACYYDSSEGRWGDLPHAKASEKARATALKALELDDSLAEAHVVLGSIHDGFDWDWAGAEREFKRAIKLNPSLVQAHVGLAWHLLFVRRFEEAVGAVNRAVEIDPVSPYALRAEFWILLGARKYDRAMDNARRQLEMFPSSPDQHFYLVRVLEAKGMYDQALAARQAAMRLRGDSPKEVAALGRAYEVAGMRGVWNWELDRWKQRAARGEKVSPAALASLYGLLGQTNQAFERLEKAYAQRDHAIIYLRFYWFDPLRADPRFQDLLRRLNLPTD